MLVFGEFKREWKSKMHRNVNKYRLKWARWIEKVLNFNVSHFIQFFKRNKFYSDENNKLTTWKEINPHAFTPFSNIQNSELDPCDYFYFIICYSYFLSASLNAIACCFCHSSRAMCLSQRLKAQRESKVLLCC